MRVIRTQDQWRELFALQRQSTLSIVDFCEQHQIATTTFYNRRSVIEKQSATSFIRATVETQVELAQPRESRIQLKYGDSELLLPANFSVQNVAVLLKALNK